jgi:hypothetical protein
MAQKVYGPIRGAGVQITELEGAQQIEPAALGWVGYAGILEKGPTGKLIQLSNPDIAAKRVGSYIPESLLPDAIAHYFARAAGAGGVFAVRVTDGNEIQAAYNLYARRTGVLTLMGKLLAHNGGNWGGKLKRFSQDLSVIGKLANTTLDTEDTTSFKADEYKGGYIQLSGGLNPEKKYPIIGNTAAGVFTVAADQTMRDDLDAGTPADLRYYIVRENEGKALSVVVKDGDENPDTEFGLFVYVDGTLDLEKPNLSTDPLSSRYWVDLVNNDDSNYSVTAVDLWTGAHTADVRPANHYGLIDSVTATVLNAIIHDFTVNSPGGGNPTFTLGTTSDKMPRQKITITMSAATTGTAVSDVFGALGTVTLGTLFSPPTGAGGADKNKLVPPFTVTAGGSPLAATDTLVVNYKPFVLDALIDGFVYPDKVNAKREKYRIVDNDHKSLTVADGSDLTASGAPADSFLVEAACEFEGGREGIAGITDASYVSQAWNVDSSPFNQIEGQNMGLIKFATPGVTSTTVQKAGKAYADAKNHQYRDEIPANILTDEGADEYINETLGRSNYGANIFPSYAYVVDPLGSGEGKLKLVSVTGMVHGREARIAADYLGYHKAEAGIDATLPDIKKLPIGDRVPNHELLNPRGVNIIRKKGGNYVIWGDRVAASSPEWKYKHQREQMSYYEHVLQENYDWIIFAIHTVGKEQLAKASLDAFFYPEWTKDALDGTTYAKAASVKIDAENNTEVTKGAGDMMADILLKLAETVERFRIRIGKAGITESLG